MTEPRNSTAAGHVPISCDLHSEYELAILRRQWLRLVWSDESSAKNVIHDQIVLPLDLKTANGDDSRMEAAPGHPGPHAALLRPWRAEVERRRATAGTKEVEWRQEQPPRATPGAVAGTAVEEFLVCRTRDSVMQNIRLDRVQRVYPA